MIKIPYQYGTFLLLIVVFITSCSKKASKQTQYIPKDASAVFSINPKQLFDKLNNNHVNVDSIMKAATAGDTTMRWTMDDIKNSGIDMESDVFMFVQQAGSIMSGQSSVIGFVGALHKPEDFEAFLKKKMPAVQIQKAHDYSYANLKNGFVTGWNDNVALIVDATSMNRQNGGEASNANFGASQKALTTYFTQKEDASIASVDGFKNASKEKADMLLYTSSNSALASMPMLGMSKASDLMKDLYSINTINFEDGKVVMDSKAYTNQMLADTLKNYASRKVDLDMIDHYPGAVNGFAVFSFDPKLLTGIMNIAGVTATANQSLQQFGFTVDDIVRAFKGDFAVVFSNFGMEEKANPEYPQLKVKQPTYKLLFNAAIGDKAAYDKIVSALAAKGIMVQQNGQYVFKEMAEGAAGGYVMNADSKTLLVASDASLLQQYKTGTGRISLPQGIEDKAKGNAVAFYADITSILNSMPQDTIDHTLMNSAKQTFKDAVITSENISGNTIKGRFELRLVNDKENSLASLTRYFGTLANTMENMKEAGGVEQGAFSAPDEEDSTNIMVDSTRVKRKTR
jgi:hypothetical protein